jgi:hypothetical protein
MEDMEEVYGVHDDVTHNVCLKPAPWGNGNRNYPGPLDNTTSCLTVCIFRTVKELHNITGSEEAQGTVEIEDLFKQRKSMKPPQIRWAQLY